MKTQLVLISALIMAGSSLVFAQGGATPATPAACPVIFSPKAYTPQKDFDKLAAWRTAKPSFKKVPGDATLKVAMAKSYPDQDGQYARTNQGREERLKTYTKDAVDFVWTQNDEAYSMTFEPEVGVRMKTIVEATNYNDPGPQGHIVERVRITNLGTDGILRGTLALPVSGRYGQSTTYGWATKDRYSVMMDTPTKKNIPLISRALSLGLVTVQDIKIQLIKGEVVRIRYEREGSAGSAGFPEGRTIEFLWE